MTRIEEQTGGPARINQISALSVRKSDSCGAGSSTRGEREGGREESVNEFVRNPRRSKHSILFGDYIRGCREKKKKKEGEGEGSRRNYGDEDLFKSFPAFLDFRSILHGLEW